MTVLEVRGIYRPRSVSYCCGLGSLHGYCLVTCPFATLLWLFLVLSLIGPCMLKIHKRLNGKLPYAMSELENLQNPTRRQSNSGNETELVAVRDAGL